MGHWPTSSIRFNRCQYAEAQNEKKEKKEKKKTKRTDEEDREKEEDEKDDEGDEDDKKTHQKSKQGNADAVVIDCNLLWHYYYSTSHYY